MKQLVNKIDSAGVKFINAYSVMTCSSKEGVCATCYGRDLARGKIQFMLVKLLE